MKTMGAGKIYYPLLPPQKKSGELVGVIDIPHLVGLYLFIKAVILLIEVYLKTKNL